MVHTRTHVLALLALVAYVHSAEQSARASANPIRKVVTMLQMMQKKVIEEGEKETELYEKYVCWCKTGASSLGTSIADATTKIGEVGSAIKEGESKKAQLEEDIKQHRADRDAAKAAMAEATAVREKEAAAYAAENAQALADIDAVEKAIAAISKGMQGSFLQTGSVQILRRLALASKDMLDADRQDVFAFLSGSAATGYAPASGQIVGILKQMHDEMAADIAEATKAEEAAIKIYSEMMAAKKKEVAVLQKSIEEKLQRVADLGVEIAEMKNDLGDTI